MRKKIMYSFSIDEGLLDRIRAKAKEKNLTTSTFIKQTYKNFLLDPKPISPPPVDIRRYYRMQK
jgi:hypothetical protein